MKFVRLDLECKLTLRIIKFKLTLEIAIYNFISLLHNVNVTKDFVVRSIQVTSVMKTQNVGCN